MHTRRASQKYGKMSIVDLFLKLENTKIESDKTTEKIEIVHRPKNNYTRRRKTVSLGIHRKM